jgi:acyl-CoA synthetase (AMP-forming)/AMP-acid ligase II
MIFRSPWPDFSVPDTSLTSFVFEGVDERASKPALVDGTSGRSLSYGELEESVRRVARGLHDRGFGKGDVFAIYSPNALEYPIAFHGTAAIGGIVTTVSPLYTPEELRRQLDDAKAKFLLTIPALLPNARIASEGSSVEEIFVLGEAEGATPFSTLLDNAGDPPEVAIGSSDIIALPYSSGTTGLQKGVMLTHGNLVANLIQVQEAFREDRREDDVAIGLLPFFHIYAMLVILNDSLRNGLTVVTMPRFDLEQMLGLFVEHRVTIAHLVPPVVLALSKHPLVDEYDFSALRWIFSGAAPLDAELSSACAKRLDCQVLQGYGLTETSPCTHLSAPVPGANKLGAVGRLAAGTECKVVDPATGEELGPGKNGELWMGGPQVMKGYLNRPDATAAVIDADGFFHSGDIGHVDEDGFFYVVDRLKELIKYKGFQVAPAELEALLLTHPAISDAAVIPKPDEEAGEVPKAFVVARGEVTESDVLEFVAQRVAPYKKLREVEIIEQIPKSASGKILRRVLVERERQKASGSRA